MVGWFSWNALLGVTLAGFALMVYLRSRSLIQLVISFFNLPLWWVLFIGQIDGFVTAGLLGLPWTIPILLIKPHLTLFAIFSRRQYVLVLFILVLFSFAIYGFWPSNYFSLLGLPNVNHEPQNIPFGVWGIPLALVGLWFSRGDPDMMMLAGLPALPYVIPYHFLPVTPAIARLKPWSAILAVTFSWMTLLSNWFGPWAWKLAWVMIAWLWLNLAIQRYPYFVLFRNIAPWFSYQPPE